MRQKFHQWLDNYRRPNKLLISKGSKLHNQGRFQHTKLQITGADSCMAVADGATICDMNILIEGDQNEIKIGAESVLDGDYINRTKSMWG